MRISMRMFRVRSLCLPRNARSLNDEMETGITTGVVSWTQRSWGHLSSVDTGRSNTILFFFLIVT
jgi:hypothetical protein